MCNRKTYKRFLNLSKYHSKYSCNHVIYDTKLGKRDVYISNPDYRTNSIDLTYFDGVDSYIPNLDILFMLRIEKSGKINIIQSKIDEPAIFSAIYEIECLIHKDKIKKIDNILEKLFENIDEYSFQNNIFGFTQYR